MESCCICYEPYEEISAKSITSQLCSDVCSHGLCLRCAITHIIAYENAFCPYCRMVDAFSEDQLSSFIEEHHVASAEVLLRAAKFQAVKEKLAVPWICDTMTTLLRGEANTDDFLPSAKLTASFHVETRSVDRRANGEIFAEFCLSLVNDGDELPIPQKPDHDDPCRVLLECTIQPLPNDESHETLEDEEEMA